MAEDLTNIMRFIDDRMIADVLRMEDLIPEMRQAMIDFSQGG